MIKKNINLFYLSSMVVALFKALLLLLSFISLLLFSSGFAKPISDSNNGSSSGNNDCPSRRLLQQEQLPLGFSTGGDFSFGNDVDGKGFSGKLNEPAVTDFGLGDSAAGADANQPPGLDFETDFLGEWMLHSKNAGVGAMQLQLMPNNKAIWFDTTNLGRSALLLKPPVNCPVRNQTTMEPDCWAHAIQYDTFTGRIKTLRMPSDTWCSSGGLSIKGHLISTGGALEGIRSVRIISSCRHCDFAENRAALSEDRWYSSNQMLEDGSFVVVGGRHSHSYEIIPPESLQFPQRKIDFPFLQETEDPSENNLYPFLFLLPDGNLFVFANDKGVVIVPLTGQIVRRFPVLPGGARNYPASGMSVLLPLDLNPGLDPLNVDAHVLICGGSTKSAFALSDEEPRTFLPALSDCSKINAMVDNAPWEFDMMPSPRVMGDMYILPNGQLLLAGGAKVGTSGWYDADEPNFTPTLYYPQKPLGQRFKELTPTTIPRMYHSSGTVLIDGKVLITGSNPNPNYDSKSKFPVELRVEKFSPPYLDQKLDVHRPVIDEWVSDKRLAYGQDFRVVFELNSDEEPNLTDMKVTMLAPPFTTHGFCQNHRMLVLSPTSLSSNLVTAQAPFSGKLAPPGYYMLFVVYRSVPSKGMWVRIR